MSPDRLPRIRITVSAVALAFTLLTACSGDDSGPAKSDRADAPSGTIVFRRFTNPEQTQAALFTVSTNGKNERQITHPPEDAIDSLPDWSPDAKQIAFHREFTDKPFEAYIVNADGTGERRVDPGRPPGTSANQVVSLADAAWSPDGRKLAVSMATGTPRDFEEGEIEIRIGTMAVDGSDAKLITQTKGPVGSEDRTATWSPDGRRIAFTRTNITNRPVDASAVFGVRADGKGAHRITPWSLDAEEPAWSPDGSLISFRSEPTDQDFVGDIYTVKPDGSDRTQLTRTKGKQVFSTSFSSDSEWIVFGMTGVANLPDLYLMRTDGSDVTPLTRTPTWESAPDWSPR